MPSTLEQRAWANGAAPNSERRTPIGPTAFEQECQRLELETPEQMRKNKALERWIRQNCNSRYVPEALLRDLKITVQLEY